MQRLPDAVAAAVEWHGDQLRKGKQVPYVSHLLGVASLVLEHGGDEAQAMAALLHDTLEDTAATIEVLTSRFGDDVTSMVQDCTDTTDPDEARDHTTSWARKERAVAHLRGMRARSVLVSACDKLHNLRDMVADAEAGAFDDAWPFNVSPSQQVEYYGILADALRANGSVPGRLVDEVDALAERLARSLTGPASR